MRQVTATVSNSAKRNNGKLSIASVADAAIATVSATSTTPDYANMSTRDLLASFWSFIGDVRADAIVSLVNSTGALSASLVTGELAALYSVAIGLRKAYGRSIKAADVVTDLPGLTIPDGFNPTFALYLSAARLRADDANERKIATEVKSAIRSKLRNARKASK